MSSLAGQIVSIVASTMWTLLSTLWPYAFAMFGLKFGVRWLKRLFFEHAIGGRSALRWYSSRWDKWDAGRKRWRK